MSTYTYICIRADLRSAENQKAEEYLFKHDRDSEDTTKLYLAAQRKLSPQITTTTHTSASYEAINVLLKDGQLT